MKQTRVVSSKREQLIKTALELFAKNGIHATGIDAIVKRSGVTKKTLYVHFLRKKNWCSPSCVNMTDSRGMNLCVGLRAVGKRLGVGC